jgi:membrane-associated protein
VAILGDSLAYATGRYAGPRLFKREDARWFHKKQLDRAHACFETHGGKTVLFGRFMPYIRTFVAMLARMGAMSYRRFVTYNVLGGLVWGFGLPWGGDLLGRSVPKNAAGERGIKSCALYSSPPTPRLLSDCDVTLD